MDINTVINRFEEYVIKFDNKSNIIKNRLNHSHQVMNLCELLSQKMGLSDEEILLSKIIGLLHDIGRFKQTYTYKTKSDFEIDHGELGVKVIFSERLMNKLCIDKKYHENICFAIQNHNKLRIENDSDNQKVFFTQILRDANKIDILKRMRENYINRNKCISNLKISEQVGRIFLESQPVNKMDVQNLNEELLQKLSLIFDMNFGISLDIIDKEQLLEFFESAVLNDNMFRPYILHAKEYMLKRIYK